MTEHAVVTREAWLQARVALLEKEKAFTRKRDALSQARRALPWVEITKSYGFDTETGHKSLDQLFGEHSQLVVYHFMFGPDWQQPCKSCSFWADNFDRIVVHLAARDVTMVAVSRAPLERLTAFKRRMGWNFEWVSSHDSDFNYDFDVSFSNDTRENSAPYYNYRTGGFPADEAPGVSVFAKDDDGKVYHTYSTYARGLDMMNTAYHYLDLVPKGRDEDNLDMSMAWVRLRDEYTPA